MSFSHSCPIRKTVQYALHRYSSKRSRSSVRRDSLWISCLIHTEAAGTDDMDWLDCHLSLVTISNANSASEVERSILPDDTCSFRCLCFCEFPLVLTMHSTNCFSLTSETMQFSTNCSSVGMVTLSSRRPQRYRLTRHSRFSPSSAFFVSFQLLLSRD